MHILDPEFISFIVVNLVMIIGAYWKLRMDLQATRLTTHTKDEISELIRQEHETTERKLKEHRDVEEIEFKEIKILLQSLNNKTIRVMTKLNITEGDSQ